MLLIRGRTPTNAYSDISGSARLCQELYRRQRRMMGPKDKTVVFTYVVVKIFHHNYSTIRLLDGLASPLDINCSEGVGPTVRPQPLVPAVWML